MHIKCALWDVEYGRVMSEWEEVEMFADTHEGVTRFHNAKEFMFRVNATGPWSGHMITILPGDSNRPFISKVSTNGTDPNEGISFLPWSITME